MSKKVLLIRDRGNTAIYRQEPLVDLSITSTGCTYLKQVDVPAWKADELAAWFETMGVVVVRLAEPPLVVNARNP